MKMRNVYDIIKTYRGDTFYFCNNLNCITQWKLFCILTKVNRTRIKKYNVTKATNKFTKKQLQ